ncbi:prefoldin subunit 6 [Ammospiza caudacuta]|uniref:prefoldin subunit 6 n=1 Tax=Ammospiza caudacuta TaxID=2857398 RepID=UPI00273A3CB8|nr:prefoldin subunit 6 [Ammospiza caudacuta]
MAAASSSSARPLPSSASTATPSAASAAFAALRRHRRRLGPIPEPSPPLSHLRRPQKPQNPPRGKRGAARAAAGAPRGGVASAEGRSSRGSWRNISSYRKSWAGRVAARQKLETQLTENNIVQEELNLLDDSTTIFKLLGPVLVKQDLEEAKNTVGKRLEYISGEMKRYEQQMQELERRSEQQRELLGRLQQELQAKP